MEIESEPVDPKPSNKIALLIIGAVVIGICIWWFTSSTESPRPPTQHANPPFVQERSKATTQNSDPETEDPLFTLLSDLDI